MTRNASAQLDKLLLSLSEENWDGYDGKPITMDAILTARRVLAASKCAGLEDPWPVPTSQGGIQLEWHINGIDVELEFDAEGHLCGWMVAQDNAAKSKNPQEKE